MTEKYLPVRQSLGYRNLRKAILKVFNIDIDTYEINYDAYEDFSIYLHYGNWQEDDIELNIGRTKKNGYHIVGSGGILYIRLPNPNIVEDVKKRSDYSYVGAITQKELSELVYVKKFQDHARLAAGYDYKSLVAALKVLRFYVNTHQPLSVRERLVFYRLSILQLRKIKGYHKTDDESVREGDFGVYRSNARMDKKMAWYQEKLKHYCDIWRAVK